MNIPLPQPTKYQGQEGEDPTSPFWASGNYVGPYWSNGKVQTSVEWGDKPALNELDALARQHDAAYAHYKDEKHREAADAIFAEEARKLKKKYGSKLAGDPQLAAAFVEYGNHTTRQIKKLANSGIFVPGLGPLAVLKYGYDHVKEFTSRIKGTHLKNEKLDVRQFYANGTEGRPMLSIAVAPANGSAWKNPTIDGKGKSSGWQNTLESVKNNAARKAVLTAAGLEVPASRSPTDSEKEELVRSQARRFANYQALHDAALASQNRVAPHVYHKPKLNMNKAKPMKKRKKIIKGNAVRPL
nr:MAG: PLA2 protein [Chemarfal virus 35]